MIMILPKVHDFSSRVVKRNTGLLERRLMERYAETRKACFYPAVEVSHTIFDVSKPHQEALIRDSQKRIASRSIQSIRAGASRGQVDDILEYGLRLYIGFDIELDYTAASNIFLSVAQGPYPDDKRAIAYSLVCHLQEMEMMVNEEEDVDMTRLFGYANSSCQLGLFSHCCLNLAMRYDGLGLELHTKAPFKNFHALWHAYDQFRKETGTQRPNSRNCASCNYRAEKKSSLKRCAGGCVQTKKPTYCSRHCQLQDWSRHKQFCKFSLDERED